MPSRVVPRIGPALAALFVAVAVLLTGGRARAWVEVHVTADDVRLTLDRAGRARVEHRIALRIAGGPLRSLDLVGVDPDAAPEGGAYVVPARDASTTSLASAVAVTPEIVPATGKPADDGAPLPARMRLRFENDRGLSRGLYVVVVRYGTDLAGRGLIGPAGAMTRIRWAGLVWDEGFDSARTTFELPPAPTEPRADEPGRDADDDAAGRPTILSSVRRSPDKDEIELLRPFVPKNETVRWAIRVDPHALGGRAPDLAPAAPRVSGSELDLTDPARRPLVLAVGGALALLYALLVGLKGLEVARHAAAAGVAPRPLVPVPLVLRALFAGVALTGGVAFEILLPTGTTGALLVALATALAAHRTPRRAPAASLGKPGRWLSITEAEAFRDPPRPKGALLDVSTRAGKLLFVLALGGLGAGVWALSEPLPYYASLLAFDLPALLVLFGTGRIAELPPDPAVAAGPVLRDVARRLRRSMKGGEELRIVPRIHVPNDSPDADELRITVVPRAPLPGFGALEVGVMFAHGAGGAIAMPEILLRVTAGSECDRALGRVVRHGRSSRGKRPDERVLCFSPRLPTTRMTASLAAALAVAVADAGRAATPPAATPPRPARRAA
jgi:hypothetical protein